MNSLIPKNGTAKTIGGGVGVAALVAVLYMLGVVDIAPRNPDKQQIQTMQIDIAEIKKDVGHMQTDIAKIETALRQR